MKATKILMVYMISENFKKEINTGIRYHLPTEIGFLPIGYERYFSNEFGTSMMNRFFIMTTRSYRSQDEKTVVITCGLSMKAFQK